jgi:hypothetical protein
MGKRIYCSCGKCEHYAYIDRELRSLNWSDSTSLGEGTIQLDMSTTIALIRDLKHVLEDILDEELNKEE